MICYRAETSMVDIVRKVVPRTDNVRTFIRSFYQTEVDIIPDEKKVL